MRFFRQSKPVLCSVCGKEIERNERRFVDKNPVAKSEKHTHFACQPRSSNRN